jgi:hypothetical protein
MPLGILPFISPPTPSALATALESAIDLRPIYARLS